MLPSNTSGRLPLSSTVSRTQQSSPIVVSSASPFASPLQSHWNRASARRTPPSQHTDNSLAGATDLGALRPNIVRGGVVGAGDVIDHFRFTVNRTTAFSLSLTSLQSSVNMHLLSRNGHAIATSQRPGNESEVINLAALGPGTYYIRIVRLSGNTTYRLGISDRFGANLGIPNLQQRERQTSNNGHNERNGSSPDWFSSNLGDTRLQQQARLAAADGQINRKEMIGLLRGTEDGGIVDATEFSDLRKVLSSTVFQMPDYVKNLTNKVVNGDRANLASGIGNLAEGSSATQMERLIGKWFLGKDRPDAGSGVTYQAVSGSLFQNGVSYQDVRQGNLNDCCLMASTAAVARQAPSRIQDMFIDNGDGTFTVRFFRRAQDNYVADYVTVDRYLPTNGSFSRYAGWGGAQPSGNRFDDSSNELWVALLEKAYAQINQSGGITVFGGHSYDAIQGSSSSVSLSHLVGERPQLHSPFSDSNTNSMIARFNQGSAIVLSTDLSLHTSAPSGVVANHSYALVGYNTANDTFRLYNPLGNEITVTRSQLQRFFSRWESPVA